MKKPSIMQGFPVPPAGRMPKIDWDRPPWNRWAFQHIREVLPTTEVWCGDGASWDLPVDPVNLDGLLYTSPTGSISNIGHWLAGSYTDGIAVIHQGSLVYERYYNGMTERTLHLSQSVAKSVTAAVAGILVDRGLLDPGARVTHYLPELRQTAWRGAKLRHVLDMTTGVRYVEDYEALDSDIAMTDIASGWKDAPANYDGPTCVWDQILGLNDTVRAHGDLFVYRSIETDVLAHCMERVTGTRLAALISRELWQPLGMEESANITVDPAGYALACGGLNASLRDYARFGLMLAGGGVGNGRRIVPYEWIIDTLMGDPSVFGPPYDAGFENGAYRNQFWIRDVSRRVMMARGVFGQLIYADLDNDLVVTKLSSWPEFVSVPRKLEDMAAIDAICHFLNGDSA